MATGAAVLQPTFHGHVASTLDGLILFEACLTGHLNHVPRRPHDRERNSLIRSGCVFIYEENASGIKRWTDGVTWSPSRILGNFLVYRELDKPFPPGEKKRAMKKHQRRPARPGEPYPRPDSTSETHSPTTSQSTSFPATPTTSDAERQLIGSLIDSYGFKTDGLVKKTMSVTVQGVTHHLVSYYSLDDVKEGILRPPSQAPALGGIRPRHELIAKQNFRAPLEDVDEVTDSAREGQQSIYGGYRPMGPPGYYPTPNSYPHHAGYPPHGHQPGVASGYPVGPPMNSSFMPHMPTPQIPPREGQYGDYNQSTYRSYDSVNSNMPPTSHANSMPHTPTPVQPQEYPNRPPSQTYHQGLYSQAGMQPRAMTAPSPTDPRGSMQYERGHSSMPNVSTASPIDHTRAQEPYAKHEDRRGSQQYASAPPYQADRQPYHMGSDGGSVHQHSYQPGPSVSPWPGPAPGPRPM